eukprot:Nk52_evm4s2273 gene=Nk52_evmTU4s2273
MQPLKSEMSQKPSYGTGSGTSPPDATAVNKTLAGLRNLGGGGGSSTGEVSGGSLNRSTGGLSSTDYSSGLNYSEENLLTINSNYSDGSSRRLESLYNSPSVATKPFRGDSTGVDGDRMGGGGEGGAGKGGGNDHHQEEHGGLSTFGGAYVPICETMWGVIIFLRFTQVVGYAGVGLGIGAVLISALVIFLTIMSLSAVATNGMVQSGGVYYMMTRSLGPAVGGSIGVLYYCGMSVLSTVEIVGATEALHDILLTTFRVDNMMGSEYVDQMVVAVGLLIILSGMAFVGMHFVHKIAVFFLAALGLAFLAGFAGMFGTAAGWQNGPFEYNDEIVGNVTGLSASTLSDNTGSDFGDGWTFKTVLTYVFPCFIGIFSAANRSGQLKNPYRSIPVGTYSATLTSTLLYSLIMILAGSLATRSVLKADPLLFAELAWPNKWVTMIGVLLVGIGSGLQCLVVAPTILQSIAADGIIPILSKLGLEKLSNGEPRRASIFTFFVALPFCFVKDLDTIAEVVTMCFVLAYAFMNFTCFLLSILKLHNWRPKYKVYHWTTAFLGFMVCIALMVTINYIFAIVAFFVAILLGIYIQVRGGQDIWGDGLRGLQFHIALSSLLGIEDTEFEQECDEFLGKETAPREDWRPQILAFVEMKNGNVFHPRFLSLIHQLKFNKGGLAIVSSVVTDTEFDESEAYDHYKYITEQIRSNSVRLQQAMHEEKVDGFDEVVYAPSAAIGQSILLQTAGLGALKPNTVLMGWPSNWANSLDCAKQFLTTFHRVRVSKKALIVAKGIDNFPESSERMKGHIDIWWIVRDGGLLLLTGYLLKLHPVWKGCKLRLFTVAEVTDNSLAIERELKQHLLHLRIDAEVTVVELEAEDFDPFAYQWTVTAQDAQKVKMRRMSTHKDMLAMLPNTIDNLECVKPHTSRFLSRTLSTRSAEEKRDNFFGKVNDAANLKKVIESHSADADLTILNLPIPGEEALCEPNLYMDLIEMITENIPRSLLLHGNGRQVISIYN